MLSHFSPVQFFATPWTAAHQAPLSMGFSRQKCWSGLPYPLPGDFPNPGIRPCLLHLLQWQASSLRLAPPGKPHQKKKKAIGCLEGSFFIIQIQHSRGEMGGSCCRSQHGVGHTSPKSLQAMTRYLWGRAAGCTFPPGSR